MKMTTEDMSGITVVTVERKYVDTSNFSDFKKEMHISTDNRNRIVIDMTNVEFIDSAGLGAILSLLRSISERGGKLYLCCISKTVMVLFELVRMHKIIKIFDSKTEALKSF
jgi:anti-sigma B factor antagonist